MGVTRKPRRPLRLVLARQRVWPIFCWWNVNRKEQEINELVEMTVEAAGCAIWGVEYQAAGKRSRLRVYIDKPGGVSIGDCERVSHGLGDLLDLEGVIGGSYDLEVSSPGLDRILFNAGQYASHVGETVDVRLNFPFEGRRRFVGLLAGVEDGQALVRIEDEEYMLPLENIQRTRVIPAFD